MGQGQPSTGVCFVGDAETVCPRRLVKLSKLLGNYLSACALRRAVSENQQLPNLILNDSRMVHHAKTASLRPDSRYGYSAEGIDVL